MKILFYILLIILLGCNEHVSKIGYYKDSLYCYEYSVLKKDTTIKDGYFVCYLYNDKNYTLYEGFFKDNLLTDTLKCYDIEQGLKYINISTCFIFEKGLPVKAYYQRQKHKKSEIYKEFFFISPSDAIGIEYFDNKKSISEIGKYHINLEFPFDKLYFMKNGNIFDLDTNENINNLSYWKNGVYTKFDFRFDSLQNFEMIKYYTIDTSYKFSWKDSVYYFNKKSHNIDSVEYYKDFKVFKTKYFNTSICLKYSN